MATDLEFVHYVLEQSGLGEALSFRKMFGEYTLYLEGRVVALACDNSLFIKSSTAAESMAPQIALRPPYPGAKPCPMVDELLDDPAALKALLVATAAALPLPKPKAPRSKKTKA